MSWRLIIATLVFAAAASAWGGLRLGDWLIIHSPAQAPAPNPTTQVADATVLDANGKPFVASAPQPLSDGRLGVPNQPPPVDWKIQSAPLLDANRPIALATTTISMDEAIALAAQGQMDDSGLQTCMERMLRAHLHAALRCKRCWPQLSAQQRAQARTRLQPSPRSSAWKKAVCGWTTPGA